MNPFDRKYFNYCEGDTTLQQADDDAEFVEMIREQVAWNQEQEQGYWLGIDPGIGAGSQRLADRFRELGMEDLLH